MSEKEALVRLPRGKMEENRLRRNCGGDNRLAVAEERSGSG